mgnify:CR=1 FL=1
MKNKIVRIAEPLDALKQYFGYDSFRGHQFEAIESILDGEDICFYAPTSLGKSIVYQISALCSEGTTIVISPLIALMSDQVDSLVAKGINAVFYNSSLTIKQSRAVLENIQSGTVKLLYVAPETLLNDSFIEILQNLNIQMIFLDEAHVCSSWGHDFRSDYKKLGILRTYFPKAVFAALTATADEITRRDIDVILKFNNHIVFMHSFDRPNISYAAYRKYGKGQDQTLELIQTYPVGTCGIVYCFTRKDTEEMAKYLNSNGIKCLPFHAGLKKSEKELAQSTWMSGDTPVIVATIAFGMGIDKPNVRFVIHASMPSSLEGYCQESGRAGRDGLESNAHLIYGPDDYEIAKWVLSQGDVTSKIYSNKMLKLNKVYRFSQADTCRRVLMLSYFGEESLPCQKCDVCDPKIAVKLSPKPVSQVKKTTRRKTVARRSR